MPNPRSCALAALAAAAPAAARGQSPAPADTAVRVTFGAFVDAYYAWDAGRPPSRDRSFAGGTPFTTQPARHDEFNVNLAFVEATLSGPRVRGRLALQAGTSVQANYAGEPAVGAASGPALARHLQEATAGYEVARGLWVDAGIFFSNLGMESWISRDNPTYTRSLAAEYSPYYSSGVKVAWAASPRLTARLDLVNGWQNVSEAGGGKAAGARVDYAPDDATTLSYYGFVGGEAGTRLRTLNGVGARRAGGRWTLVGQVDVGTQRRAPGTRGVFAWLTSSAVARYAATDALTLAARAEYAADPDQVVIGTGARSDGGTPAPNAPLRAGGGSLGADARLHPRLLWRTEARGWRNRDPLFPDGTGRAARRVGGFAVTSLALTF